MTLRMILPDAVARQSPAALDAVTLGRAQEILADCEARREPGVMHYAELLGDLAPGVRPIIEHRELRSALESLPAADRAVLEHAAERIRAFAAAQREALRDVTVRVPGGRAGHTVVPVGAAGCYAPGGRYPLPSSALMTAVTARAAGVPTVILASPRPTPHLLAAAHLAGVDAMLALGGVQAIAAMMLGLFDLPAADMIVGPGNRWVTAAKHLVSHRVGIDMLAGPSELLVLADESADPGVVAADLLAQAEHDDDAVPMLVTWHGPLAEAVNRELDEQLKTLPTATTARKALENGWICIARDEDQALALVDCVAPEHLEILTRDARRHAAGVRNAGAIFIGAGAAEVLGDYGAGPNHTLPTAGAARFRAGLSVFAFLRARTWMEMDAASAWAPLAREAAAFARLEGLEAHARAAERRL